MEGELTESEREQLQKIGVLQKVIRAILAKWLWVIASVFLLLFGSFTVFLIWHSAKSEHRFDAITQLLYTPKQVSGIQNVSDKQLMTILERNSIKRKVGERIPMNRSERECLTIDLNLEQARRQSNLFKVMAQAPTWSGAVKKANAYAALLIEEYIAYRQHDLENLRESINVRKKNLQRQATELESEESIQKGKSGVIAPAETLAMINSLLSDQRRNLSMLSVQMANEEMKRKKLEDSVGVVGAAVSANAATIRQKSASLEAIDKEIAKLREIYTDKNPKVLGKLDERNELLAGYKAFLKEKGIEGVDIGTIDKVEKSASELAEVSLRIEVLKENHTSLLREIKENENRSETLTKIIPLFERLKVRRADIDRSMRDLDDQLENIDYLLMSTENDLRYVERAGGAGDNHPIQIRNFAIAFGGASICTLVMIFWILTLELVYGKVSGGKEMMAYNEMNFLGSLPEENLLPEAEEQDVRGVVALRFANIDLPNGIVLECRLPGASVQPKFREALVWSLAMSGRQSFALEIVSHGDFTPPEDADTLLNTSHKGLKGWFPVENRYALAPTELQMLQADLAELRKQYDHVFVFMPDGVRRGGSFFDQLLSVCDSVLLVVGVEKTPRSWFAYARDHVRQSQKPMMGLAVGAAAKTVQREMEAKK